MIKEHSVLTCLTITLRRKSYRERTVPKSRQLMLYITQG